MPTSCSARKGVSVVVVALVAGALSGCAHFFHESPRGEADRVGLVFPERLSRGCVFYLTGVAGECGTDRFLIEGLKRAELDLGVIVYDWTDLQGGRRSNLQSYEEHRVQAQRIAERIATYQRLNPGKPVHLLGYSGGAAMVAFVLESLSPEQAVDSAIMLAPVVAPEYDLSRAMERCRGPIYCFYSSLDVGALMLCTTIMGNMDGYKGRAAGAAGFVPPPHLTAAEQETYRRRLIQVGYDSRMLAAGHLGGHYGWTNPWFVGQWIVPLLRDQSVEPPATTALRPEDLR